VSRKVRFRARKTFRIGPTWLCLRLHFSQAGYRGWSTHVLFWTYSRTTDTHSLDTPGLGRVVVSGRQHTGTRRRR
jgi:hypothetical protein